MSKYEIKADGCDYGIYENGNLRLFVNSQANALLIKYVLEQDSQHKVVIADLLEKMSKKKRKFRAMTNKEVCIKWQKEHNSSCYDKGEYCPLLYYYETKCWTSDKPFRLANGKYIFIEVKE